MKLLYINNILLPSEYAHSIQIMKMCEAFSDNNIEVVLLVPNRRNRIKKTPYDYYNVKNNFKIIKLPCIDFFYEDGSKIMYWLRFISFYISAKIYTLLNSFDVIYTRDLYAALFFNNFFYEMHDFPKNSFVLRKLIKKSNRIFTTNNWKKQKLLEMYPNSFTKIEVSPNSVDDSVIRDNTIIREVNNKIVVGYFGSLKTKGMDKGVKDLLLLMTILPNDFILYLVGGEVVDVDIYKNEASKMKILDKVVFKQRLPHNKVLQYMRGCDVLVAPFPENEHYSFFMSPLKIFEYMASGKPIVATNLPSIKEILTDGKNSILISPSNPAAMAEAIVRLKNDPDFAKKISNQAHKDVSEKYTWGIRAKKIISFIKSK